MVITQKITSMVFEIHDGKTCVIVPLTVYLLCVYVLYEMVADTTEVKRMVQ